MTRKYSIIPGLCLVAVIGWSSCAKTHIDVGAPWDTSESQYFDDGVDLIRDPLAISGEWAFRQRNWLEARIQLADSVAVVEILSVQTRTDVDGRQSKRIDVSIVRHLYAKTPAEKISLSSPENSPGHELILRYERHLEGRFLLFSRWFKIQNGKGVEVGHHFHLSPASEALLAEVESRVQLRIREEEKAAEAE